MSEIVGCTLVIKDDFNNVLVLKKKVKKGEAQQFCLINNKIRGKETTEKCINRGIKDTIKCIVFDMEPVKEIVVDKDNGHKHLLYVGNIKEKPVLEKGYTDFTWISKRQLDSYNLQDFEKDILVDIL